MSNIGHLESLLGPLPADIKPPLQTIIRELCNNWELGSVSDGEKARNARLYRFDAVTSTSVNGEFTINHGLGQVPRNLIPFAPLNAIGGQIVRLQVTRPADVNRVYLSSPDTNAAIAVLLEM